MAPTLQRTVIPPPVVSGYYGNQPNFWASRANKPKFPRLKMETFSKEYDVTFSLGRPTDETEVMLILLNAGCVKAESYMDSIRMLKIRGNVQNGQVLITCKEKGQSDEFADKINALKHPDIRKCHSYTSKQMPVRINFIHPTMNVQEDFIKNFLEKEHGEVLDHFPNVTAKYGIPDGSYTFIMKEDQLEERPLPESIFLNQIQSFISYRTQIRTCHKCDKPGHMSDECTNIAFPLLSSGTSGNADAPFLPGPGILLPTREQVLLNRRKVNRFKFTPRNTSIVVDLANDQTQDQGVELGGEQEGTEKKEEDEASVSDHHSESHHSPQQAEHRSSVSGSESEKDEGDGVQSETGIDTRKDDDDDDEILNDWFGESSDEEEATKEDENKEGEDNNMEHDGQDHVQLPVKEGDAPVNENNEGDAPVNENNEFGNGDYGRRNSLKRKTTNQGGDAKRTNTRGNKGAAQGQGGKEPPNPNQND